MNISRLSCALLLLPALAGAEPKYIKFATLAPDGSTWMKVMRDLDADLKEKTKGTVQFKFYPGGVAGDEKDVVRKARIGQLHAAGFTGIGLGEIAPEVRVLEAPWLFNDANEVDHIVKLFEPEFTAALKKAGYVPLGWMDLGFVYVFSKKPITGPEDMKKSRMWMWEGDPIAQAVYEAIGISPIPLSIVDVLSSLQTGMIDAVYGPPLGVIALQWFTRTKYIYPVPMAESAGAALVTKKLFDTLTPEEQKILLSASAARFKELNALTRKENDQAMETLKKQGLTVMDKPSPEILRQYREFGIKARQSLAGKLYSAELLARIEKALEAYRAKKPAAR